MKKICILIIAIAAVCLSGCVDKSEPVEEPEPAAAPEPATAKD